MFALDQRIDHQQLRKWGLTKFEGAVHIPGFFAKVQNVFSLLIFVLVYGDHITEKYSRFK